jgi:serine/threonine protein phosphatase 1
MWGLLRRKTTDAMRLTSPAPGMRVYAVGDLHGRIDLFEKLRDFVGLDQRQTPSERPLAVFLGDVIDRGPGSADIVQGLVSGDFPVPFVALRGNHEQMLLDSLTSEVALEGWLRNGGVTTLMSYGINLSDYALLRDVRDAMAAGIPQAHLEYMATMPTAATSGDYFFCHAGVRPDVSLEEQSERDLLWIRKPFLTSTRDFGKRVVHGHSPVASPEVLPNRINIDTGAYATGLLTCLVLDGTTVNPVRITTEDVWA